MNRTAWIIIALAVVVGLGALVVLTKKEQVNVDAIDPAKVLVATDAALGDNIVGKADSKVVLIEYADFQCGGCAAAHDTMKQVHEKYKDTVAFVYRNFPLTSGHPNALAAATVAEAAGRQGKYWEMNDILFTNQQLWSNLSTERRGATFEEYAKQLNLDLEQYRTDLTSTEIQRKISVDRGLAGRVGVTATPTFFLGSEKMSDAVVANIMQSDGAELMDALDAALKEAGVTPPERNN